MRSKTTVTIRFSSTMPAICAVCGEAAEYRDCYLRKKDPRKGGAAEAVLKDLTNPANILGYSLGGLDGAVVGGLVNSLYDGVRQPQRQREVLPDATIFLPFCKRHRFYQGLRWAEGFVWLTASIGAGVGLMCWLGTDAGAFFLAFGIFTAGIVAMFLRLKRFSIHVRNSRADGATFANVSTRFARAYEAANGRGLDFLLQDRIAK